MKLNKIVYRGVVLLLIVLIVGLLFGCQSKTATESATEAVTEATEAPKETQATEEGSSQGSEQGVIPSPLTAAPTDLPIATLEMADGQVIRIALYPQYAPNTVNNFIELSEAGFYDGLIFHRIINGFMIQGGDPQGTGSGGPGYGIPGEFMNNGFDNPMQHYPGVLSMARAQNPDSAGSQFFICQGETSFLDGDYAAFGLVFEGQAVVDALAAVPTDGGDRPIEDVVIKRIVIDRQGYSFDRVDKIQ